MKAKMRHTVARAAIGLVLVGMLAGGLNLVPQPALARQWTTVVNASGAGRCPPDESPSEERKCKETWTHVNLWTHYTSRVPPNCTVEIIEQCGVVWSSISATSSCDSSDNCSHGPHDSTPQPTGPGTWTKWDGHYNTNYRWQTLVEITFEHEPSCPSGLFPGLLGTCVKRCPDGTHIVPGTPCPSSEPSPPSTPPPVSTPQSTPTPNPQPPDSTPHLY